MYNNGILEDGFVQESHCAMNAPNPLTFTTPVMEKKPKAVALAKPFQSYTPPTVNSKIGVLFFNLGGPDDQASVKPFLQNLFADNDIVQVPFPQVIQTHVFAKRIAKKREHEAQENYAKIGGGSPILELTQQQIALFQNAIAPDFQARGFELPTCYLAMRYWHPFLSDVLKRIQADGITHLILLPLYPHYCLATTGSSLREFSNLMLTPQWFPMARHLNLSTICSFYKEPLFLQAVAQTMQQAFDEKEWSCPPAQRHIIFSAHGIPKKYAAKNRDPYPRQIHETCHRLMQQYFPENTWEICWQSRVGPMEWLKPYTEDLVEELGQAKRDNILMVPISFVSDHIETLFEMDMLYVPVGAQYGMRHWHRAASLNDSPLFTKLLCELVLRMLDSSSLCKIDFSQKDRLQPGQLHCASEKGR
jgi:protoporphyrin/coproporphyrin ferrochelatase